VELEQCASQGRRTVVGGPPGHVDPPGVLRKEEDDGSGVPPGHVDPVRACGANGTVQIVTRT
jgi:hypothetical protein